jgi:hypothetical protein
MSKDRKFREDDAMAILSPINRNKFTIDTYKDATTNKCCSVGYLYKIDTSELKEKNLEPILEFLTLVEEYCNKKFNACLNLYEINDNKSCTDNEKTLKKYFPQKTPKGRVMSLLKMMSVDRSAGRDYFIY